MPWWRKSGERWLGKYYGFVVTDSCFCFYTIEAKPKAGGCLMRASMLPKTKSLTTRRGFLMTKALLKSVGSLYFQWGVRFIVSLLWQAHSKEEIFFLFPFFLKFFLGKITWMKLISVRSTWKLNDEKSLKKKIRKYSLFR